MDTFAYDNPAYIASCSFGKDSIATILLALEHGEPLDAAVFSEVMFDHRRNISGEMPEHIEWIYSTAIPRLAALGGRTGRCSSFGERLSYVIPYGHRERYA